MGKNLKLVIADDAGGLKAVAEDCFTYLQFPKEVWHKIRTTNLLEREFRELRRRMNENFPAGGA